MASKKAKQAPLTIIGIEQLLEGDVIRQINAAIAECISDITNFTKSATQSRGVTMTLMFKPEESRTRVALYADVKTKVAGRAAAATKLNVGIEQGALFATEASGDEARQLSIEEVARSMSVEGELTIMGGGKVIRLVNENGQLRRVDDATDDNSGD